jgi:AbrB family looped-hinge helix DNA binding protein
MKELVTTVTQKGQVTIPSQIRQALDLKARDKVVFTLEEGEARLRPATRSLLDGFGAVKPRQRPEDFRKVRRETEEWVAGEVMEEG